jgi:hypothetical protein
VGVAWLALVSVVVVTDLGRYGIPHPLAPDGGVNATRCANVA